MISRKGAAAAASGDQAARQRARRVQFIGQSSLLRISAAAVPPALDAGLDEPEALGDRGTDAGQHEDDDEMGLHLEAVAIDREQSIRPPDRGIESSATGVMSPMVAPSRRPTTMKGSAPGNRMRRKI